MKLTDLGYAFPSADGWALAHVTARFERGEKVLVTGPSGSGKSTLLRLCAGLLQVHGEGAVAGSVRIDGMDPTLLPIAERPEALAYVGQEPGDMLVTGTVADEIAFGPESAGWDPDRVERRIRAVLEAVGLAVAPHRDPSTLSGGQKQRLAIGAALAAGARHLLLDEPLSQLDPVGAEALLALLDRLASDGVTVIMAEHRLDRVMPWANRVLRLDEGALVQDVAPASMTAADLAGLQLPMHLLNLHQLPPPEHEPLGATVLEIDGLAHRYGDRLALDGVSFDLRAGERLAVIGVNGAGKSTLLTCLSDRGLLVPQDPDLSLFGRTIEDELAYGPREQGRPLEIVHQVANRLRLGGLLGRSPQAVSRGQRLRTAVGAALTCTPEVLLLDEPTAGQDRDAVHRVMAALEGTAVVFATHDLDLVLRWAHRVLWLTEGRVEAFGPVQDVFAQLPLQMLPPVARLCRQRGWPCLSADQLEAR